MRRSYDFYKEYLGMDKETVDRYMAVFKRMFNGKFDDRSISSCNNAKALKMCLYENLFSTFKALLYPSVYIERGNRHYRYLVDPFSNGLVEFIDNAPTSSMEAIKVARFYDNPRTDEEILRTTLVIPPEEKESLLDKIFHLDRDKINRVKIKDVKARTISGWSYPIYTERDVIYYSEISNVYPSLELFRMNILTTYNDTFGCEDDSEYIVGDNAKCEIRIDYNSLSDENKIYADYLLQTGQAEVKDEDGTHKAISIYTPCKREETIGEVNVRTMEILKGFHKQDILFGTYSYDDLINIIRGHLKYIDASLADRIRNLIDEGLNSTKIVNLLSLVEFDGYYYDEEEDKFWKSKTYYDRHMAYKKENRIESAKLEKKKEEQ